MPDSLRDQHKRATAQHLFEVAVELFERDGFGSVTIEEIALAAGVSARTFYRYFPIKEAVLYPDREQQLEVLRNAIVQAEAASPPWRVLEDAVLALARSSAQERDMQRRRSRVSLAEESVDRYRRTVLIPATEDVIAAAFAERLGTTVDTDPRPNLLAGFGLAVMSAVGKTWVASDGANDVEADIRDVFSVAERMAACEEAGSD